MSQATCTHYWSYPHAIYEGRNANEIAAERYCEKCEKQEAAFASKWGPVPRQYKDMRDEMRFDFKGKP